MTTTHQTKPEAQATARQWTSSNSRYAGNGRRLLMHGCFSLIADIQRFDPRQMATDRENARLLSRPSIEHGALVAIAEASRILSMLNRMTLKAWKSMHKETLPHSRMKGHEALAAYDALKGGKA